jgi:hypothetical protein
MDDSAGFLFSSGDPPAGEAGLSYGGDAAVSKLRVFGKLRRLVRAIFKVQVQVQVQGG